MDNLNVSLLTAIIVPIITSVLTYLSARYQSNSEIKKIVNQQNMEMKKIREQQRAELIKIKEQHEQEINKLRIIMETQAGLYEKNAQTDLTKEIMQQMMSGNTSGIEALMKISDQVNMGKFNPRRRKR